MEASFESDFAVAAKYIGATEGYIAHRLLKCLEEANKYLLVVEWKSLEAHTVNFRTSPQYQEWKKLLHHYYNPFPVVEHYVDV